MSFYTIQTQGTRDRYRSLAVQPDALCVSRRQCSAFVLTSRWARLCLISAAIAGWVGISPVSAQTVEIVSQNNIMSFPGGATHGLRIHSKLSGWADAFIAEPARIYVCQAAAQSNNSVPLQCADPESGNGTGFSTAANSILHGYDSVHQDSQTRATAIATLTSANQAIFRVTDVFQARGEEALGAFTVSRKVEVLDPGNQRDIGFNSQFVLAFAGPSQPIERYHFFAPAIWYDKNLHAARGGIGTDVADHDYFYWRETRSSLPFVMVQDPATGTALSIGHTGTSVGDVPKISSGVEEGSRLWITDSSVRYGSLGVEKMQTKGSNPVVSIGFAYPAEEGDVSYVGRRDQQWVRRSHPVVAGLQQFYTLTLDLTRYTDPALSAGTTHTADFAAALAGTWRRFYDIFNPPTAQDTSGTVWRDGIQLLKTVFQHEGEEKAPGFPFKIGNMETGEDDPYSYQMGFTGQQIPLGFQLFRYGILNHDSGSQIKGQEILDFWAIEDPKAQISDLPLTWFQPNHGKGKRWINLECIHPIFMRSVTDGMEGMVDAAVFARRNLTAAGGAQGNWERFADQFGRWLLKNQAQDGSFQRAFNADGSPWVSRDGCFYPGDVDGQSPFSTTFPIRFLVSMWFATGNPEYRTAAVRAGDWAYHNIYTSTNFIGGVANRNALDKEAGSEALHAALALYDLAYQKNGGNADAAKWLKAAELAANYLETWQYAWNFDVVDHTPGHRFRAYTYAGTRASSFIGTGGSAVDVFLAISSFDFYRLHLLSGEGPSGHYGRFAALLANDAVLTTQLTHVPGQNFGYKYDGLAGEAVNLANMSFRSGDVPIGWLAWITNSEIDPERRLDDVFHERSVSKLLEEEREHPETLPQLREEDHHIYPAPGSLGWGK